MSLELREVTLRDAADVHIHPTTLALAPQGFNTLLGETLADLMMRQPLPLEAELVQAISPARFDR